MCAGAGYSSSSRIRAQKVFHLILSLRSRLGTAGHPKSPTKSLRLRTVGLAGLPAFAYPILGSRECLDPPGVGPDRAQVATFQVKPGRFGGKDDRTAQGTIREQKIVEVPSTSCCIVGGGPAGLMLAIAAKLDAAY
jgi:hypothetical protein